MAKEKNSKILDKVQGALLDDRDFLREIIENFCQRLIRGRNGLSPSGGILSENRKKVWLSQRVQIKETKNQSRNLRAPCSSG